MTGIEMTKTEPKSLTINPLLGLALAVVLLLGACETDLGPAEIPARTAMVGIYGATVEGTEETLTAGVKVSIPEGALTKTATLTIAPFKAVAALPPGAHWVGTQYQVTLDSAEAPTLPVVLTVPYDAAAVADYGQEPLQVKIWMRSPEAEKDWELMEPNLNDDGTVSVTVERLDTLGAGVKVAP